MYSYTDDDVDNPRPILLRVTIACEEGRRCHVSFSAGLFKPQRLNIADYQWLVTQHRVGDIVERCDHIYRPMFDYLAIFRNLRYIWDNVLTPEQRIPFMVFLGFLQSSDNMYLMRYVDDSLGTSSIETPWIAEQPGVAAVEGWTAALIRGRVLSQDALGTGESQNDATGETEAESEDMESDKEEPKEIPRIVSREEPKDKRPYVFLKRGHRLAILRTGEKTIEARKARAVASGRLSEDSTLPLAPGGSAETGSQKGRRKALQPQPAPSQHVMRELAYMYRVQHGGTGVTNDQSARAPCPLVQEPPGPLPPLDAGEQLPGDQEVQESVLAPGSANVGPFARPWEAASLQAPPVVPILPRQPAMADPEPTQASNMRLAVSMCHGSAMTFSPAVVTTPVAATNWTPVPQLQPVSLPLRPIPRRATLPGLGFGGEGVTQVPGPRYVSPREHPQAIPIHGVAPMPSESEVHSPAMSSRGRHAPRVRRAPVTWQTSPYLTPDSTPVRVRLALMRSRAQGSQVTLGSIDHQGLVFPVQRPTAHPWQLVPEQQMYYGGHSSQGTGVASAPVMTPAPPQYFEHLVHQPVRQPAPEAYGFAQPHMATPWPFIPEQQRLPGTYASQDASLGQIPVSTPASPVYGEGPAYAAAEPGAPLSFAVTQYNLSRATLGTDAEEEGTGDSDASELCEAMDLSIHGRPQRRTPESMIVRAGNGQGETGESTRMVLVSAMVHLGQGADLPDLEDPPDDE